MKKYLPVFCAIFWAGLITGISFLEAPLKFQAPGITLRLGLGIGKLVFQSLNKIEIILMILILIGTIKTKIKTINLIFLVLIVIILIADTFWLLPYLDQRATAV